MGQITNKYIFKVGNVRSELVRYKDGIGGCVWVPMPGDERNEEFDESGLCFDFSHEDLNDLAQVMINMQNATNEKIGVYEYDEEDEAYREHLKEQETFWYRFKWWLRDWGFQFMPFDWEFKLGRKKRIFYTLKTPIFAIGPFKFTKGEWR